MADKDLNHWETVLAESEERLAELADSPDPVAQRQIAEALWEKGKALDKLGRLSEAVTVWGQVTESYVKDSRKPSSTLALQALLNRASDLMQLGRNAEALKTTELVLTSSELARQTPLLERQVLAALGLKAHVLWLDDREASISVEQEISRRFRESSELTIRERVTGSLVRQGVALIVDGDAEGAIRLSVELAERFAAAPDETLAEEAEAVNRYAGALMVLFGTDWRGMTEAAAFVTTNTAAAFGGALLRRIVGAAGGHRIAVQLNRTPLAGLRLTPGRWEQRRRQAKAAMELYESVIRRIGAATDTTLRQSAMVARVGVAQARLTGGQFIQGSDDLEAIAGSADPAAVAAFQEIAGEMSERSDIPGQLTRLGMLYQRAVALGEGDERIERIAYQDSVKPLVDGTRYPAIRWLARLLTPGKPDES